MNLRSRKGFSLIEALLSLTFFLMIILSSFEFFGTVRRIFFRLKDAQERSESAAAALEKMRMDVLHAGRGLAQPMAMGIVSAVELKNEVLGLTIGEKTYSLTADLQAGQTTLPLLDTEGLRAGREVCVFGGGRGEILGLQSVDESSATVSSPLISSYPQDQTRVVLLQKISFYLERGTSILRRKVNSSPGQPLIEGVRLFGFSYDGISNLIKVQIGLEKEPEKIHELFMLPKNVALAKLRQR